MVRPLSKPLHRAEGSRSEEPFRLTLSTALHTPPVSLLDSGAFFGGGERADSPQGVHGDFGGEGLAQFPDQSPLAAAIAGDGNASLAGSGVLLADPNQLPKVSILIPLLSRLKSTLCVTVCILPPKGEVRKETSLLSIQCLASAEPQRTGTGRGVWLIDCILQPGASTVLCPQPGLVSSASSKKHWRWRVQ